MAEAPNTEMNSAICDDDDAEEKNDESRAEEDGEQLVENVFPSAECLRSSVGELAVCSVEGCGKKFKHRGHLKLHLVQTHKIVTDETDRLLAAGKGGLNGRKKTPSTIKRFYCPVVDCRYHRSSSDDNEDVGIDKYFRSIYLLKNHFRRNHNEKTFTCSTCGVSFSLEFDFTRHKKLCGLTKQCPLCDQWYFNLQSFNRHVKSKHMKRSGKSSASLKAITDDGDLSKKQKLTPIAPALPAFSLPNIKNHSCACTQPVFVLSQSATPALVPGNSLPSYPSANIFLDTARLGPSLINQRIGVNPSVLASAPFTKPLFGNNVTWIGNLIRNDVTGVLPGTVVVASAPVASAPVASSVPIASSIAHSTRMNATVPPPATDQMSASFIGSTGVSASTKINVAKRKSSAETQTSKDLTIGESLSANVVSSAVPSLDIPDESERQPTPSEVVSKQSRGAQVSPRSKILTSGRVGKANAGITKEKKHNETQTKTMTISKLGASLGIRDRPATPSLTEGTTPVTGVPSNVAQPPSIFQRRFKVAASRGTHADMRSPPRGNKSVNTLPLLTLHDPNDAYATTSVVATETAEEEEERRVRTTPPTPTTMTAMLRELDSIFESISTQTKESFLLDKSRSATNADVDATEPEDTVVGRDVRLVTGGSQDCREENDERSLSMANETGNVIYSSETGMRNVTFATGFLAERSDVVNDGGTIFEVCENDSNDASEENMPALSANALHMETQTDISSQVLEGLWSLSGQRHQIEGQRPHQPPRRQLSVMTHIETQTLDSEPVGFCNDDDDNNFFFSHMETQTTDDLFPDLMDCLASVGADSMEDVIQCHDLHAPHVLRIFCDDEPAAGSRNDADYVACRDATTTTTNFSLHDGAATLDQCVQTARFSIDDLSSAQFPVLVSSRDQSVTTRNETTALVENMDQNEFFTEVSALMDSQTQTTFHHMEF